MNFDVLNFYIGTFNKAQKNGTLNEETLLRLKQLYLLGDVEEDVYLTLVGILNKCLNVGKAVSEPKAKPFAKPDEKWKVDTVRPKTRKEAQNFLDGNDVFIIYSDGCRSGYRNADIEDVCDSNKKLYFQVEIGRDPCCGTQYDYQEIIFSKSQDTFTNVGSCEGIDMKGGC